MQSNVNSNELKELDVNVTYDTISECFKQLGEAFNPTAINETYNLLEKHLLLMGKRKIDLLNQE